MDIQRVTEREGTTRPLVPQPDGRSLNALFHELSQEASALFKAERALMRSEMEGKIAEAQRGAVSAAAGGAILAGGALTLLACGVLALALVLPAWLSALVVGVVASGIGLALVLYGRRRIKEAHLKPERTLASLKNTTVAMKREATS